MDRNRGICFLLAAFLLLGLCACQGKPQPAPSPSGAPTAPPVTASPEPTAEPTPVPTPEPPFVFTRQNFPRLNGSTSTVPLAEAVCSALLGESREDVGDLIHFSKTTQAYRELLSGNADLLIIGEANEEIMGEKEARGFEWLKTPFATDAFVFVVNENNPVDSITVEEARKIYTGEIMNWVELGGDNVPIIPFQRNAEAGSQTLMEKHVMQGTPMMEAPEDYIVASMGGLMAAVKSYDNSAGAIGYSVYYYAEEMKAAQGLKLLKLEGVEPCPDTIRSEEYPIVNPKYVVISAAAADDSPTRRLYDWLLSEEGQALIAAEGYVSVMDFETSPRRSDTEPVGVFWEGPWEGLEPLAEPERVTAYAGARLSDHWPGENGCLFGLMTLEGEAVTPPVYSVIYAPLWQNWFGGEARQLSPLVLRQGSGERGEWGVLQNAYALVARDLSWVYPGTWRQVLSGPDFLLLLGEDRMEQVSEEGKLMGSWNYAEAGLEPYVHLLCSDFRGSIAGSVFGHYLALGEGEWRDERTETYLFDLERGEFLTLLRGDAELCFKDAQWEDVSWRVTETEGGCRLTRGEESLELPLPPPEGEESAVLWGDLVIWRSKGRIFFRDGREVLPPAQGERGRGVSALPYGLWYQMTDYLLLCLRVTVEDIQTTRFIRSDGSVMDVTLEKILYDEDQSFASADAGILGIVERDRASYYRIDTEECVFRIPLYYEKD